MREDRLEIEGVPARLYVPGAARGLLLFGHGGAQSKDGPRFVRLCRRFAEETDLAVVCIDAVDHGDRRPSGAGLGGGIPPRWHSNAIDRMVTDWQQTAADLASIGQPLAYVGFSMGMIFGAPTVAALPTVRAAVYGVGGIPTGAGIVDPPLGPMLLAAAASHHHAQVLMINVTDDEVFPIDGTLAFLAAIPGTRKRLMLWPGRHDDWPDEAIDQSVAFVNDHTR
jgi:pimeloyl-ACP methyl ester carboxylesterase